MNEILSRYCPRTEFESYEDFYKNYACNVPEDFNFAYDVVDEWARIQPEKLALLWTDDTEVTEAPLTAWEGPAFPPRGCLLSASKKAMWLCSYLNNVLRFGFLCAL